MNKEIKPIDEHEWSDANVVEYVENDENSTRIYFCGDYNYLELSDADIAVLANARGCKPGETMNKQIKSINDHEWMDIDVFNAEVFDGVFSFEAVNDDGLGLPIELNVEDIKAIANALGYKLTKLEGKT